MSSISAQEQAELYQNDASENPPRDVIAFNEMRSAADILRLYNSAQLEIQPDFQRDVVWSSSDQTKFVDSLTKQLPIPSMCFSLDLSTESRIVIDGLQRINTIIQFLSNDDWTLSKLEDIDSRISGRTAGFIKREHPDLYSKVENIMIPVTIIRCDYTKLDHMEYLYTIFHRLNSGGLKLNNQEIRNCIYNGSFNKLLKQLATSYSGKGIFGQNKRFINEEYILRFFAFNSDFSEYSGKLSKFLNIYMGKHRDLTSKQLKDYEELLNRTLDIISNKIVPEGRSLKDLSRTSIEGLMYGISKNLDSLEKLSNKQLAELYDKFINLKEFDPESLKEGLSSKKNVTSRLEAANRVFKA